MYEYMVGRCIFEVRLGPCTLIQGRGVAPFNGSPRVAIFVVATYIETKKTNFLAQKRNPKISIDDPKC